MIVGISGFAGAGKDTFADFLVEDHGFCKTSLANPIKEACKTLLGFTDEQLYGPSEMREKPDERLPFSGVCVICHKRCDPHIGVDPDICYLCRPCNALYHRYVTPRLALQTLGTEWGRTLYSDIWVDALIRKLVRAGGDWVVPDVRFKNEVSALRKAGAFLTRINRGGISHARHQSEAEMREIPDQDFNLVLANNSSLEELRAAARVVTSLWRQASQPHESNL